MYNRRNRTSIGFQRFIYQLVYHSSFQLKFILVIILFLFLFILINFTGFTNLSHEEIVINNGPNSLILDALIEQNDQDSKIVYELVYPFGDKGIFIYNMSEPIESWWPFECYKTKMRHSINTRLCIHDPKYDKQISEQIKSTGLWEPVNVRSFMRLLNEVKDANVLDIGANIGLYSLLAAKLNRTVISIEPVHENLNRIHKAATLEQVQSNIIGLVNAVSNERKQVTITILDSNMGGSYVRDDMVNASEDANYEPTSFQSVIVNSILMDDVLDVIKAKMNSNASKKFVLKVDIEAYEPFAFLNSSALFSELKVVGIFLELGKSIEKLKGLEKLKNKDYGELYLNNLKSMLKMFKNMNFEPYEMNGFNKLDYAKWKNDWPWDVYFRQCDLVRCSDHEYKLSG